MKQPLLNEHVIRDYLLGTISEGEREQIEERMLTDDLFFENLAALEDVVEDDLIDQYLNDDLTSQERKGFEQIFLSTGERREKLELARDLSRRASLVVVRSNDTGAVSGKFSWFRSLSAFTGFQNPLVGIPVVAALLLLTFGCIWLSFRVRHLGAELSRLKVEQPQPSQDQNLNEQLGRLRVRNEELTANIQQTEEQRARLEQELTLLKAQQEQGRETPGGGSPHQLLSPVSFSIVLPLVQSRGAESNIKVVNPPPNATRVQLVLGLDTINPNDYKSYQVIIEDRGGAEVWRTNKVRVRKRAGENYIVLTLPASRLSGGEYNVELNGVSANNQSETIGAYSFRVISH